MVNKKIILASSSPRRIEILKNIGLDFEVRPSDYEEFLETPEFTYQKIENLAYNKAKSVLDKIDLSSIDPSFSLILSADTVVVLEGLILGKPQDCDEAICMLKKLSGNKHSVVTSVCIINLKNFTKKLVSETSYVEFEELTENIIIDYVDRYKPLDKAGSYGIQELPEGFVKTVEGSFENIIGLCSIVVQRLISELAD